MSGDPSASGAGPLAPEPEPSTPSGRDRRSTPAPWVIALLEVLLCSDVPTQTAIRKTLEAVGYGPYGPDGTLRAGSITLLSLADTVLLAALILLFLKAHGERPRELFLGSRPVGTELAFGLPLVLAALGLGITLLVLLQYLAPSLHTVAQNPLQTLIRSPVDIGLFALVVVVAGGIREEFQRAFLLHRFEQHLGGATVGVVVTSLAFGAGHLLQGVDAAIVTGVLGAFWGLVYLRRRSVAAPVVSHAGFNLMQIVQFLAAGR